MDLVARNEQQLAAALRRHRKKASFTQSDLAGRINKRQATISGLETGKGGTLDTLFAILGALDLELVVRLRTKTRAVDLEDMF